jgi:hypothetical protein
MEYASDFSNEQGQKAPIGRAVSEKMTHTLIM